MAPVTRAVRLALAATTLALVGTGAAHAGTCSTGANTTQCTGSFIDTLSFPDAVDLTLVVGDGATPTSVTPGAGAPGIDVDGDGAIDITSNASISTYGADGIHAYSTGSAHVTNNGDITTHVTGVGQEAIDASAHGNVTVDNNGALTAYSDGSDDVTTVRAETVGCGCTASVDNGVDGSIITSATDGSAIGIYAYAGAGHVDVDNGGYIGAFSRNGLADGIFAAGVDADVHTSGTIVAEGYAWAAGVEAEGSDLTTVRNDGNVHAYAQANGGQAFGIYAAGGDGGAAVDNIGAITAIGYYATGIDASATGHVGVTNAGDITIADSLIGTGIHAASNGEGGSVDAVNDGSLTVHSYYGSTGIEVVATGAGASGSASNTGSIYAVQASKYGSSVGIVVSADGDAHIDNSGSVDVVQASGGAPLRASQGFTPYFGGTVYGAMALSFNGDASVSNSGDIGVASVPMGYAAGILAASQNGNASVDNSGLVTSQAKYAYGIVASAGAGDVTIHNRAGAGVYAGSFAPVPYAFASAITGITSSGDVLIDNAGTAYAYSFETAVGLLGLSKGTGNIDISNSGLIGVYSNGQAYGGRAIGIAALADGGGSVTVDNSGQVGAYSYYGDAVGVLAAGMTSHVHNSGTIHAYGYTATGISATDEVINDGDIVAYAVAGANGVSVYSFYTDSQVTNTGSISATGLYQQATGISAAAPNGTVIVDNSGSIDVYSGYVAEGIFAFGNSDLNNSGDIGVEAAGWAAGIEARGGTLAIANEGGITATSHYGNAFGIYANGADGVDITNAGAITATGPSAFAIYATGSAVTIDNSGSLEATSGHGAALGIVAAGDTVHVDNEGDITADTADGMAFGVYVAAGTSATVANSGHVSAHAASAGTLAIGLAAYSAGTLHVTNAGTISATADDATGQAVGLDAIGYGIVQVDNAGLITASHQAYAIAVALDSATGSILTNTGTVRVDAPVEGQVAVRGGDWIEHVVNYGELDGALVLNGGDDVLFNGSHGVWNVGNHMTDFGAGNDTLANAAGGLVNLTNASIAFGDGDDTIVNGTGGTLLLHGGAISLGSSDATGNSFTNNGTIRVLGTGNAIDMGSGPAALVPSLNPLPLVNNGVIDFVDGAPDDVLTITGDLDGHGRIQVDLRPLTHASDMLYVDGSVANGAVQTVDVDFGAMPTSAMLDGTTAFAHVTGNSTAGSFVAGRVIGYTPGNFLDLQVQVTSQIDASGAASDVFSVGVQAAGLSNTGSVAAALAPGAQNMVNSLIGTWRQRTGVQVDKGTIGISPWLRMFNDRGSIRADHVASNFGQTGEFGFDEANSGWELGLDARPFDQVHVGVLLGESDGNQRLSGVGSGDINGQTFGVYGTWIGDAGYYVDASFRWTGLAARARADGMQQYTDGEADSFNIEAGFGAWTLPGGVLLQPQVQYTHTSLDLRPLVADLTTFDGKSATSSRGRVGVLFSKTIDDGGWTWVPYGALSAVREFDGEYTYTIDDDFAGTTSTKGTSALVELGLGVHKDKVTVSGGLNWSDGGVLSSFFGGQLVLRYTF